ncbi:DNase I-like protein [Xylariomycetidae sp. FL2044]|nr:DNase I-like protein [Xylariomycetidae sp. FL2044]
MRGQSLLAAAVAAATTTTTTASAQTIHAINGHRFLSPYAGQAVSNVTGVVTAKGPEGLWIRSLKAACDARVSDGLYVYGSSLAANDSIAIGDVLVLDGTVSEYRSDVDYLPLTELGSPKVRAVLERGLAVEALVLGPESGRSPPTAEYSALDGGDVFAVPNNQTLISVENPELVPESYGLDFWESLMGQLVTIRNPRAVGRPNTYGDTWVVGDWNTSGDNDRTGLTVSNGDGNPEAILIGSPLDGSDNPTDGRLGDKLEDITGVVYQAFGFYRILPLTSITVLETLTPAVADPTTLTSDGSCSGLTVAGYNVENLYPGDTVHIAAAADHFVHYLRSPDLIAVQEVQDNNGETDDGTVDAGVTLATLAAAVAAAGGPAYNYTWINPVDNADGGAPGGNIRVAYMYRADVLQLQGGAAAATIGNATAANAVLPGPALLYNPGLIDPTNDAWTASRKPLVAAWELVDGGGGGATLFTVNVHFGSKGGSSSLHGDARPPVNGGVEDRQAQAELTASFIADILAEDASAKVVAVGDFNEYVFVSPVSTFLSASGMLDLDEVVGIEPTERYSYLYDMNSQELDHMFVSPGLAETAPQFEHLHINTWVPYDDKTSDHDPSVAKFSLC